jgi:thiol:disulfide interchange protein DsbD
VFLAGTVSGFVAAPCAGPVLVAILAVAANSQDMLWGALLLFVYALGFGTIFLVLGTFSSALKTLPRAGNWMGTVKLLIAAGLFGVVFFVAQPFLKSLLSELSKVGSLVWIALGGVMILAGGFADRRQLSGL